MYAIRSYYDLLGDALQRVEDAHALHRDALEVVVALGIQLLDQLGP